MVTDPAPAAIVWADALVNIQRLLRWAPVLAGLLLSRPATLTDFKNSVCAGGPLQSLERLQAIPRLAARRWFYHVGRD